MSAIFDMELQEDAKQLQSESDYEDDTVFFIFVSALGKFHLQSSVTFHMLPLAPMRICKHANNAASVFVFLQEEYDNVDQNAISR